MWRIHRGIGMGGVMFVPTVGGLEVEEAPGEDLRGAWGEEFDQLIGEIQPFEGAHELLAEVKERGFRLVLASSGKTSTSRHPRPASKIESPTLLPLAPLTLASAVATMSGSGLLGSARSQPGGPRLRQGAASSASSK